MEAELGPTQQDLDRLEDEFREVTRHGFDGGAYGAWLDDAAAQVGVDPDLLASQLAARAVRAALASHEAHKQSMTSLGRGVNGEQRRRLRRRLDHVGEQSYRSQVVVVRELHGDLTGRRVCEFLGLVTRPRQPRSNAARARRPRRSSSSSRTSGVDPGDGDDGESEPAGVAARACRRRTAGGRP
jgi:hypothetical protein